jgi:uncharacterized protein YndB with AHSA1/START domain
MLARIAALFLLTTSTAFAGKVEAKYGLDVETFTPAPLRATATARLDAPIEEVWAYVSDHENLVEYAGAILQRVSVSYTADSLQTGVGVQRTCAAGDDHFVEEVVFFKPGRGFAYSATENTWGLTNHLATVSFVKSGRGTKLVWSQYFDHVQPEMAEPMATNLQGMLEGPLLGTLVARFGGEVLP